MPKKAYPKLPKGLTAGPNSYKPPTIDDVKNAVTESLVCWAWYVNPFHNFSEDEYYMERIYENHDAIVDFEQQQTGRSYDKTLDMKTDWLGMRVIEIAYGIGSMIHAITQPPNPYPVERQKVVACAKEIGLPSTFYEVLSIYNLANGTNTPTDTNEKYPGLRLLFERMHKTGATRPTINQIADEYKQRCGWDSGLDIETIAHHIKNNSSYGVWTGSKYQSRKSPG
jgi:hypothetical protein